MGLEGGAFGGWVGRGGGAQNSEHPSSAVGEPPSPLYFVQQPKQTKTRVVGIIQLTFRTPLSHTFPAS